MLRAPTPRRMVFPADCSVQSLRLESGTVGKCTLEALQAGVRRGDKLERDTTGNGGKFLYMTRTVKDPPCECYHPHVCSPKEQLELFQFLGLLSPGALIPYALDCSEQDPLPCGSDLGILKKEKERDGNMLRKCFDQYVSHNYIYIYIYIYMYIYVFIHYILVTTISDCLGSLAGTNRVYRGVA